MNRSSPTRPRFSQTDSSNTKNIISSNELNPSSAILPTAHSTSTAYATETTSRNLSKLQQSRNTQMPPQSPQTSGITVNPIEKSSSSTNNSPNSSRKCESTKNNNNKSKQNISTSAKKHSNAKLFKAGGAAAVQAQKVIMQNEIKDDENNEEDGGDNSDDELLFLDAPVEVTHNHYKKIDPIVQTLKVAHGYGTNLDERTCLYKKKLLTSSKPLNSKFFQDAARAQDQERRLRECVEKTLKEDEDIELDYLLSRELYDTNEELLQKKLTFLKSMEEYNKIIQFQLVKDLITVKHTQNKLAIDFMLKIQEIRDYATTIEDFQRTQQKLEELLVKAPKSLPEIRKKEIHHEIEALKARQEDKLQKITLNIDLILHSENVISSPIKNILLFHLEAMLFFLDELQTTPTNYAIFRKVCRATSSISLTDIDMFERELLTELEIQANQDDLDRYDEEYPQQLNQLQAKSQQREFLSGKKTRYAQGSVPEMNPIVLQIYQKYPTKDYNYGLEIEEQLSKIQLRYNKYLRKKEKKEQLSSPPSVSSEIIRLELQKLERFYSKLSMVEKVLARPRLDRYEGIQKYLRIVWQQMDILAIQISCAKNKLEKYLISLNERIFVPQAIERIIHRILRLLSGLPDEEQANSYLENQKRNNTFKRYRNDLGKITNYHFVLNATNLKPVLQKIEPNTFIEEIKRLPKQTFVPKSRRPAKQNVNSTSMTTSPAAAPNGIMNNSSRAQSTNNRSEIKNKSNHPLSISVGSSPVRVRQTQQRNDSQDQQKSKGQCNLSETRSTSNRLKVVTFVNSNSNSQETVATTTTTTTTGSSSNIGNTDSIQQGQSSDLLYDPQSSVPLMNLKRRGSFTTGTASLSTSNALLTSNSSSNKSSSRSGSKSNKLNSNSSSSSSKVTAAAAAAPEMKEITLDLSEYISSNFDKSGQNDYFCQQQSDIQIASSARFLAMSNIFSRRLDEDRVVVEDFIEKEKAKFTNAFSSPLKRSPPMMTRVSSPTSNIGNVARQSTNTRMLTTTTTTTNSSSSLLNQLSPHELYQERFARFKELSSHSKTISATTPQITKLQFSPENTSAAATAGNLLNVKQQSQQQQQKGMNASRMSSDFNNQELDGQLLQDPFSSRPTRRSSNPSVSFKLGPNKSCSSSTMNMSEVRRTHFEEPYSPRNQFKQSRSIVFNVPSQSHSNSMSQQFQQSPGNSPNYSKSELQSSSLNASPQLLSLAKHRGSSSVSPFEAGSNHVQTTGVVVGSGGGTSGGQSPRDPCSETGQDSNLPAFEKIEEQLRRMRENQSKENVKLKARRDVITKIFDRKRPRYICVGQSHVAVKGTQEELLRIEMNADIAQLRSQSREKIKQKEKLRRRISLINRQWEASNIEVLSGPPKKLFIETSTIQSDFADRLISKIIKR